MLADRIIEWYAVTHDQAAKDSFAARAIQWLVGQEDHVQAAILQRPIKPSTLPRVAIAGVAMGLAIFCFCWIAVQPTPQLMADPVQADPAELMTVYITPSGRKYHYPDCRTLQGQKIPLPMLEASRHYQPCAICFPEKVGTTQPTTRSSSRKAASPGLPGTTLPATQPTNRAATTQPTSRATSRAATHASDPSSARATGHMDSSIDWAATNPATAPAHGPASLPSTPSMPR